MSATLGLDIGSHNIKLIELVKIDKQSFSLVSAGSMPAPTGSMAAGMDVDDQAIVYVIKQLLKETGAKSRDVNIALPESQVFTRVIEVPSLSAKELTSAIKWEAEQYVRLPLDQVNIDYTILRDAHQTGTGKMDVLLVAAPKALIERYLSIADMAELNAIAAETEIIATTRALVRSVPNVPHAMIISMGAKTTDIAILKNGLLMFTRSIAAGGDAMSRALMQALDFSALQSEEYKKTYGLQKSMLEGKIVTALKPITDTLTTEMQRAIGFFEERYKGEHIGVILVSGGSAKLPGLVSFFTETLGIETQLANPWVGIAKDARFSVLNSEGPLFSVAVGLALREAV